MIGMDTELTFRNFKSFGSMSASQQLRTTSLLIQQQSSDNYLGLNLGKGRGRGRYAVAQMLTCHWSKLFMAAQNIIGCDFTVKISLIPYNRDRNFYLLSHSSPPLPPPLEKYLWKFVFYNQSCCWAYFHFFPSSQEEKGKQARKRNWNSQP